MDLNNIEVNQYMTKFIKENDLILITTSYKDGNIILLTTDEEGCIRVNSLAENRPMCIHAENKVNQLYISNSTYIKKYNIDKINTDGDIKLELLNAYFTSDIDVHDIFIKSGKVYFCSSLLNSLCKISTDSNYPIIQVWKPSFITENVVEDRCHLNGITYSNSIDSPNKKIEHINNRQKKRIAKENKSLSYTDVKALNQHTNTNSIKSSKSVESSKSEDALTNNTHNTPSNNTASDSSNYQLIADSSYNMTVEQEHLYASCVSKTNVYGGWKQNKKGSGVIINVKTGEDIIKGLSMPHSPRYKDDNLYFLNSGKGEVCKYSLKDNKIQVLAVIKGFIRGLHLFNDKTGKLYGFVSCSKDRHEECFRGLELESLITNYNDVKCGIYLIDLSDHDEQIDRVLGYVYFNDIIELYDVSVVQS
jgi:hypothetical protein